ncbi:transglycosylase domain-containing protein [Kitasatospora sp. McL0602]|uniref:transglycosylase domain-containing protein n=1 Tax=Kitasatospora sp. McL0602 TaxID=3439530 RepID=UPI003F8CA991
MTGSLARAAGAARGLVSGRRLLSVLLLMAVCLFALLGYAYARTSVPEDLNAFATRQSNVYLWSDGSELARTGLVDRQDVPLELVPASLQAAVVAAENESFYSDPGISPRGMLRALRALVVGGETQGGSTITQQYVKNAYLSPSRTLRRKVTEILLAVKLDGRLSKSQILEGYLNTSWFGRGAYGIQRAAQAYYGKDVAELDLGQGAFLVSLLKGAGQYDPAMGPASRRRAVDRWGWVLDRMVRTGRLSAAERARWTVFPEPVEPTQPSGLRGQTGYLVDLARQYVLAHSDLPESRFASGGYRIRTTFERSKVVALAESARGAAGGVSVGAASVATDGRILAVHGGPDYLSQTFDNANTATVPAGSAFAPFVYAAALDHGVQLRRDDRERTPVGPDTCYDADDGSPVRTPEGPYWDRSGRIVRTANDDGRSWGSVTLRTAVEQSVNAPMTQLGMDVGLDRVAQTATALGLLPSSLGERVPAFALGNSTPSAVRMADAYTAFAAHGLRTEPYSVLRLTRGGRPVALRTPTAVQAIGPRAAGLVHDALVGAVRDGTARAALLPGRTVAGKTGTTPDDRAGWFVGCSGQICTAVVVFRLDPKTLSPLPLSPLPLEGLAATYPLDIWRTYLTAELPDAPRSGR